MPQVINTNVMSLTAQRNLNSTNSMLATAMQRLSSGLRINSAKDDAAGLAISTRMTTQINGLDTAARNANDGISLAQTTGSALAQLTNNLQAIRNLAVQSANATNSDSDRAALNAEVQQRLAEITRISTQTTFNGRHVLDGSFGSAAFQVGANVGETITIDLEQGTRANQIGQVAKATSAAKVSTAFTPEAGATSAVATVTGLMSDPTAATYTSTNDLNTDFSGAGADKSFDVDGTTVTLDGDYSGAGGMDALVADVQAQLGSDYVVGQDANTLTIDTAATGSTATMSITDTDNALGGTTVTAGTDATADFDYGTTNKTFTIDGNTIALTSDQTDQATLVTNVQNALDTAAGAGVYTVAASGDAGFTVTTAAKGSDAEIEVGGTDAAFVTENVAGTGEKSLVLENDEFTIQAGDGDAVGINGTFKTVDSFVAAINASGISGVSAYVGDSGVVIESQKELTLGGAATAVGTGKLDGVFSAGTTQLSGSLEDVDVLTVAAANNVINRIDSALSTVSSVRSNLGAIQNRFASTISNLQTISENLSASRSRIRDTDFAAETAKLSRAQILQQAGIAMLAQANAQPQSVLQLLR